MRPPWAMSKDTRRRRLSYDPQTANSDLSQAGSDRERVYERV
jgi:hypothetical protein